MKHFRLFFCALFTTLAHAQTGTGTVQGKVQDPTRSAIAAAKVTLTSQATNIARRAESSAVGKVHTPNP